MSATPFDNLLSLAGTLIAAAGSFTLAWRGRSKIEPHLSDLPGTPIKVASLANAVLLAILWYDHGYSLGFPSLPRLASWCLAVTIASLLLYVVLITALGYEREVPIAKNRTERRRILGGLWLARDARVARRDGVDVQTILKRAANEPDRVWPRLALAASHSLVMLSYLALMISASLALAAGAILLDEKLGEPGRGPESRASAS